jgi:hypothetical protein
MLIVPRASVARRDGGWRRWLTPRLIPLILAVGASGMKLFAIPAAVAAALFYVLGRGDDGGARDAVHRAAICAALGLVMLAPFLAANLAASGCPLFPSPVGCVEAPWSIGRVQAADYARYIRDVARWETRHTMSGAARLPWVGPWIVAHPVLTTLGVLVAPLAVVLLRGPRRDGVRSVVLVAILGIAFAAWQAPAPRFLFAFVIIVPAIAVACQVSSYARQRHARVHGHVTDAARATAGFVLTALVIAFGYAIASQKLNVRSAILSGTSAVSGATAELLVPAAPKAPPRLYMWRVNDVDLVTPVPQPVADTLNYYSAIDGEAAYEQCSTAPLPCTPYLPTPDVRLREPSRGLSGGFIRSAAGSGTTLTRVQCRGELRESASRTLLEASNSLLSTGAARCGDGATR